MGSHTCKKVNASRYKSKNDALTPTSTTLLTTELAVSGRRAKPLALSGPVMPSPRIRGLNALPGCKSRRRFGYIRSSRA